MNHSMRDIYSITFILLEKVIYVKIKKKKVNLHFRLTSLVVKETVKFVWVKLQSR